MNNPIPHDQLEIGQRYWLISNVIGIIVEHIEITSKPKDEFIRYRTVGKPKNQYAILEGNFIFHDELSAHLKALEILHHEQVEHLNKIIKLIGEKI